MNILDMYTYVSKLVDDIPVTDDVIRWLNAGQNILAAEIQAVFPQLQLSTVDATLAGTFAFDVKWHHIPCVYAAAMYKAQDTSFQEEQMFLQQFNDLKKTFVQYYDPPLQYVDSAYAQLFTATAGQLAYVINKISYDPVRGDVQVYYNGRLLVPDQDYSLVGNPANNFASIVTTPITTNDPNGFTLNAAITVNTGDLITAVWQEHFDLVNPPYDFWRW